jgi:hypothetical protein
VKNPINVLNHTGLATVYLRGGFGYKKYLVRSVKVTQGGYAQYERAFEVAFVEKGKRREQSIVEHNSPSAVIVAGHCAFDPGSALTEPVRDGGVVVQRTRYTCFDPRWDSDFAAAFDAHLADHPEVVLVDLRKGREVIPSVKEAL